jgi:hypothetical protein
MSKEIIAYLKLLHGAYNTLVILFFIYHGSLGLRIRRSDAKPFHLIRKHRKIGPVAAALGISGFIIGMALGYLDSGRIFQYPLHFITGLTIVFLIITTYFISRKIRDAETYWRNRHYALGILIICLYSVQAFLGLGILL